MACAWALSWVVLMGGNPTVAVHSRCLGDVDPSAREPTKRRAEMGYTEKLIFEDVNSHGPTPCRLASGILPQNARLSSDVYLRSLIILPGYCYTEPRAGELRRFYEVTHIKSVTNLNFSFAYPK